MLANSKLAVAYKNFNDICDNTDGPEGYYAKSERERQISYDLIMCYR